MSVGKIFIKDISDLNTPWSVALAANDRVFHGVSMTGSEGEVYVCEIETANPGLALLAPGRPKFAYVSWSPTGLPANAVLIARGRWDNVPSSIDGPTITQRLVCAPQDIDAQLKTFANTLKTSPFYDALFDSNPDDARDAVLAGRASSYHVHPVTHTITTEALSSGNRTVNVGRNYDNKINKPSISLSDPPVRKVKLRVVAEWTQRAQGVCDLSSRINPSNGGYYTSLDPSFVQFNDRNLPQGQIDFLDNPGWTLSKNRIRVFFSMSAPVATGRYAQAQYRVDTYFDRVVSNPNDPGGPGIREAGWENGTQFYSVDHQEMMQWKVLNFKYDVIYCDYNYSQGRKEIANIVYTHPLPDIATAEEEHDLGEITLNDLVAVEGFDPWDSEKSYVVGDKVSVGMLFFQCIQPTPPRPYFWVSTGIGQIASIGFTAVESPAAISDERQPSFFETFRGMQALEHAVQRCRAFTRNRARYLRVAITVPWAVGIDIDLRDSVRIEIASAPGTLQPMRGKVVELSREWTGTTAECRITIAVAVGTGVVGVTTNPRPSALNTSEFGGIFGVYGDEEGINQFGFGDVDWAWSADEIINTVDTYALSNPFYAVLENRFVNNADQQLAAIADASNSAVDMREPIKVFSTKHIVSLRPAQSYDTFVRDYDVAAVGLSSPRGIDLVTGGEP